MHQQQRYVVPHRIFHKYFARVAYSICYEWCSSRVLHDCIFLVGSWNHRTRRIFGTNRILSKAAMLRAISAQSASYLHKSRRRMHELHPCHVGTMRRCWKRRGRNNAFAERHHIEQPAMFEERHATPPRAVRYTTWAQVNAPWKQCKMGRQPAHTTRSVVPRCLLVISRWYPLVIVAHSCLSPPPPASEKLHGQ